MQQDINKYLQSVGLSEKEIAVYSFLLTLTSANPILIAKEVKLKRSTVYVILELLKEKGLVREVHHGKRHVYEAENVERIRFLLEERKLKTEENIKNFEKILPSLKATIRKKGDAPIIKFYEGDDAVQISMQELVSNPNFKTKMDYGVFPLELIHKLFQHKNLRQFLDQKIKDNNKFQIIYSTEEGIMQTNPEFEQKAVRIDAKEFPLSCDISVFEDEVRFHMLGDTVYGILIKNPELAETLKSLIQLAIKNNPK